MINDNIDVIPDYTGTIVLTYYHEEPGTAEETLAQTKKLVAEDGIVAFNTFGFNNTYTLALDETKAEELDRKSTRLNSSHVAISYAVFCLKKKKETADEHAAQQTPRTRRQT